MYINPQYIHWLGPSIGSTCNWIYSRGWPNIPPPNNKSIMVIPWQEDVHFIRFITKLWIQISNLHHNRPYSPPPLSHPPLISSYVRQIYEVHQDTTNNKGWGDEEYGENKAFEQNLTNFFPFMMRDMFDIGPKMRNGRFKEGD